MSRYGTLTSDKIDFCVSILTAGTELWDGASDTQQKPLSSKKFYETTFNKFCFGTIRAQSSIATLRALRNGLVCSCTPGVLHLYEKTDDKELYHLIREFRILVKDIQLDVPLTDDQEILGIAVSPEEEYILCTTERNLIFHVNLSTADFSQGEFTELEPLLYPTHTGSVFGLGVCHRRPLFATCGTDRTVRVWNYSTRSLEMMKKFAEEALCLSFHPTGLMILVGFSDRLRLMYLMHNDIKSSHDIAIRGCRECCFSHGGHLFAAVNGNVVQVYSSVTFETLSHLKGHISKVRNIAWSANDTKIVTTAIDGHVCTWNPLTGNSLIFVSNESSEMRVVFFLDLCVSQIN